MKKVLGLSTLALAGVLAFTGCSKSELDVDKANTVMQEMEDYLEEEKAYNIILNDYINLMKKSMKNSLT